MSATPAEARFWSKVNKTDGCWLWTGGRRTQGPGTGLFRPDSRSGRQNMPAHRYAYELEFGPIPKGQSIRQACGDPLCVRTDHMVVTGRTTRLEPMSLFCINGHFRTAKNLSRHGCRTCANAQARAFRARKKARARWPRRGRRGAASARVVRHAGASRTSRVRTWRWRRGASGARAGRMR